MINYKMVILVIVLITGCISKDKISENISNSENNISSNIPINISDNIISDKFTEKEKIPSDKYVFINHYVDIYGELIEGNYVGPLIDFPTYHFDEAIGTLRGIINFDVNDTLKVIYGNGTGLGGVVGGGMATSLSGIYKLPYTDGIKISEIDSNGTVYLEYNNESIILKSGETWVNVTSRIEILQLSGQINKAKVNVTITDKIVNYGILDKSKILIWDSSNDRYRGWKE
jgi:hypothetical protein